MQDMVGAPVVGCSRSGVPRARPSLQSHAVEQLRFQFLLVFPPNKAFIPGNSS